MNPVLDFVPVWTVILGMGVFLQLGRGIIGQRHGPPRLCSSTGLVCS